MINIHIPLRQGLSRLFSRRARKIYFMGFFKGVKFLVGFILKLVSARASSSQATNFLGVAYAMKTLNICDTFGLFWKLID